MCNHIVLKRITNCVEDCDFLYSLQIMPNVRTLSLTKDIPKKSSHIKWFEKHIDLPECYIYRVMDKEENIGMIRVNLIDDGIGELSIIINPLFSGKGYAKRAIEEITKIFNTIVLHAVIHQKNIASIKAFEINGFVYHSIDQDEFNLYKREVL